MSFDLSIIIPTCGRPQILRRCLDCIANQTLLRSLGATEGRRFNENALEVIVVSDGPDEKTVEMFAGLTWPFEIQYFAIPKSQQGVCRNRGVAKARSKLVLLIGDDIFLAPDACERHVRIHEKLRHAEEVPATPFETSAASQPPPQGDVAGRACPEQSRRVSKHGVVVLGFTTWDPSLKITPLMKWMEKSGVQFGYSKIAEFSQDFIPTEKQHWFTYTSHISLPAKILYQNKFREDISLYGWEDIEWGKRLADAGVRLFYEPNAKAYHHHSYSDEEVWERSRLLGVSAKKMEDLLTVGALHATPLQVVPRGCKKLVYYLFALLPTYRGKHCRAFLKGMSSA